METTRPLNRRSGLLKKATDATEIDLFPALLGVNSAKKSWEIRRSDVLGDVCRAVIHLKWHEVRLWLGAGVFAAAQTANPLVFR